MFGREDHKLPRKVCDFIDDIIEKKGTFSENDVKAAYDMIGIDYRIDHGISKAIVASYMERRLIVLQERQEQKEKEEQEEREIAKKLQEIIAAPIPANQVGSNQSGVHGGIKTCPNCGATVEAGSATCKECGYTFVGVGAVSSVAELDRRLNVVTFTGYKGDEMRANIISSFPIPNTREDLFEFLAATAPKAFNRYKEGSVTQLGKAYYEKFEEALSKARISFPGDPALEMYETQYQKDKKKIRIHPIAWFFIAAGVFLILALIFSEGDKKKSKPTKEEEIIELFEKIDALDN